VKDGVKFAVDNMVLFQMLGDSFFYQALPAYCGDLQQAGKAAYDRVVRAALKNEDDPACFGCSSLNKVIDPWRDTLGQRLAKADAGDLEALAAYIGGKRGYRPRPIVMYYKDERGKKAILSF